MNILGISAILSTGSIVWVGLVGPPNPNQQSTHSALQALRIDYLGGVKILNTGSTPVLITDVTLNDRPECIRTSVPLAFLPPEMMSNVSIILQEFKGHVWGWQSVHVDTTFNEHPQKGESIYGQKIVVDSADGKNIVVNLGESIFVPNYCRGTVLKMDIVTDQGPLSVSW